MPNRSDGVTPRGIRSAFPSADAFWNRGTRAGAPRQRRVLRGRCAMGPLDSRHGIRELEEETGAAPYLLFWAGLRSRNICRVRPFHGRSGLRTCVHRTRRVAHTGSRTCRAARTSGRGPVPDVDVAAAEFARISGENAGEYSEADGVDALGGGNSAD